MKYSEISPSIEFDNIVLNYWKFEIPDVLDNPYSIIHETMPENTLSIVFINQPYYSGIKILAPHTKKFQQQVYPGSVYIGVRLNPWVKMDKLVGKKTSIINKTTIASSLIIDTFREIKPSLLTPEFSDYDLIEIGIKRLVENNHISIDPIAKYICNQLKKETQINKIIKKIPSSIRPIQKNFKTTTGISMSNFRSISRLKTTVKMISKGKDNITSASSKNNYTNYSHFTNTFKKYMDGTVKDFLSKSNEIQSFKKK